jgi:lysophospholipase L1-like esterase
VLGDSVTFGHGVDGNQTYPEYLENLLNTHSEESHFDVINTSVPGNSPFQEYYDLQRGLKFSPDLVILQFTLNDVTEPYRVLRKYGGKGKDYHKVEDCPYYDYLLSQHSAFYLFLKDMIHRIMYKTLDRDELQKKAQDREEFYVAANLIRKPDDPQIKEAWDECLGWMQRIIDLTKKERLPCILLVSPFSFQFPLSDQSVAYPQNILKEFAIKNDIIFIDLLELLNDEFKNRMIQKYHLSETTSYQEVIAYVKTKDRTESQRFWEKYFLDKDHYTATGHQYVAEILYEIVMSLSDLDR